jgi:hypothetical protein
VALDTSVCEYSVDSASDLRQDGLAFEKASTDQGDRTMNRHCTVAVLLIALAAPSWACPRSKVSSASKKPAHTTPLARNDATGSWAFEEMQSPPAAAGVDAQRRHAESTAAQHTKRQSSMTTSMGGSGHDTDNMACPGESSCIPGN